MNTFTVDIKSLRALICEWVVIAAVMLLAVSLDALWAWISAGLIVATRQHALLILFHDAVHGHLARNPRVNDLLINLFAGVPAMLPALVFSG